MPLYFLDSSALVKRYIAEAGSTWVTSIIDPSAGNENWLSEITRVEVVAAFHLRLRTGTLTQANVRQAESLFRNELTTHYRLLPVNTLILNRAMDLVALHGLRAYDAVQLAAGLTLQTQRVQYGASPPTFVSADQRLNQAAAAEGLAVDDPNQHP